MKIDRMYTRLITAIIMLVLMAFAYQYINRSRPRKSDVERAANVIRWMTAPMNMRRSVFFVGYPNGTPSDYVSYMFSEMGSSEWPPYEENMDPEEIEMMGMTRIPYFPSGVEIIKNDPDPEAGSQIVISADDTRGVIIVRGYDDPAGEPSLTKEYPLQKVEPEIWVHDLYESKIDMGYSDESD